MRLKVVASTLLGVALAAACSSGGGSSHRTSTTSSPSSPSSSGPASTIGRRVPPPGATGTPAEVSRSADPWPLPGHDYDNSRSAVATIDSSNVSALKLAWQTEIPGGQGLTTAPIVAGSTVYVQASSGTIAAIDGRSGATKWTTAPLGLNIGPYGVAIGDGRLYADDGYQGVVAVDLTDGKTLWRRRLTTTKTLGIDIQPTVFGGMVSASTVPVSIAGFYTPGDRGELYALDDRIGRTRWSFDTVQGDLWGHPEINSGGGAWYPPAIDTKRRIALFGIANPAPFPGTKQYPNGTSRPGANLHTDSIVALDVDRGSLLWFHQVTLHDLFDRDQIHALIAHAGGRDIAVSAGKSGVVAGVDIETGALLWQTPIGRHEHDDAPLTKPTDVYPGTYGGVLTPPATADGVVYLATLNSPTKLPPDGVAYFGSQLGTSDGEMDAIDARTGTVLWTQRVPSDPLGGATVVNDLVFTANAKGDIVALRRRDGAIVWRGHLPGGVNGWMTVVDDTIYVPVRLAGTPRVVALRLPGDD